MMLEPFAALPLALAAAGTVFSIPNTTIVDLPKSANGIEYQLYVHVPQACAEAQAAKCKTVYLLDAENAFPLSATIVQFLSDRDRIPPLISVGIAYTHRSYFVNRTRDYTPFHYVPGPGERQIPRARQEVSGGGPAFLEVIRNEIVPYVESHFPASPDKRTLVGHSYGGLFATYAWMNAPDLFSKYIIISPSLWYAHQRPIADLRESCAGKSDLPQTEVFLAVGEYEEQPENGRRMVSDLKQMETVLKSCARGPVSTYLRVFTDETHASVVPAALSTGLRKHFQ